MKFLVPPKTFACDDGLNEITEALVGAGHFLADLVDARAIAAVQLATDGVGEKFLGQATGEGFVLRDNQLPELGVGGEGLAIGQFAGRIHLELAVVLIAPTADGVVVLQGEARRVDLVVALGAGGVRTVLDQLFPQSCRTAHVRLDGRHVVGRGRRGVV